MIFSRLFMISCLIGLEYLHFSDSQAIGKRTPKKACSTIDELMEPLLLKNHQGYERMLAVNDNFRQIIPIRKCNTTGQGTTGQGYCSAGCICKQEMTLRYLFVYDQNDLDRGLFGDWFDYPSGCSCACEMKW